jgi:1-acyl-sn-glycerol-3-phosphate acyltransferase
MGTSLWGGVARALTRRLFGLGFRFYLGMTCEGLEHVPKSGPFLVASNHNSHVDTAALLVLLGKGGRPIHPVAAKDYFFRSPWRSWASRLFLGAIPFDRQSAALESLGLAVELLRREHALIFFPEGGRSQDGKIRPFKRGIGFLALESGVPILPVRIEGSFQALPKGRFFLRRHPIRVRIGPPISMEPYLQVVGPPGAQELARRVTEEVEMAVKALA